jgi:hypothetical protein
MHKLLSQCLHTVCLKLLPPDCAEGLCPATSEKSAPFEGTAVFKSSEIIEFPNTWTLAATVGPASRPPSKSKLKAPSGSSI